MFVVFSITCGYQNGIRSRSITVGRALADETGNAESSIIAISLRVETVRRREETETAMMNEMQRLLVVQLSMVVLYVLFIFSG